MFYKAMLNDFLDILYPECCHSCQEVLGKNEELICTKCQIMLPISESIQSKSLHLSEKFLGRIRFAQVIAFLQYTKSGEVQRLIKAFKYHKNQALGNKLSMLFAETLRTAINDIPDVLIPVPLHPKRLKWRGFNQTEIIAKNISNVLQIPYAERAIVRKKHSVSQTKNDKLSRWENAENVYAVIDSSAITGKHVAIVDDVITTGATVENIASLVQVHHPTKISIFCLAEAV